MMMRRTLVRILTAALLAVGLTGAATVAPAVASPVDFCC
jgi:hypothetical protein